MRISIPANIVLKLKQPKCRAWIEKRPAPESVQLYAGVLHEALNKELPIKWDYIVWEKKEGYIEENTEEFRMNLVVLLSKIFREGEGKLSEDNYNYLVWFYEEFGPLFREEAVPVHELEWLFHNFYYFLRISNQILNPDHEEIINDFYRPLMMAQIVHGESNNYWELFEYDSSKNEFRFMPINSRYYESEFLKKYKFLIVKPKENIGTSHERLIRWIRQVAFKNLNKLLNEGLKYKSGLTTVNGKFILEITPQDAFTLILLQSALKGVAFKKCAGGCGKLTRNDSCASCSRKAQVKENVLTVFRNWVRRGHITKEEYEKIRIHASKVYKPKKVTSLDEIKIEGDKLKKKLEDYLRSVLRKEPVSR
ncbi:MAG: hypothetical protein A4E56_01888 [Pelotomaculum sp. PtaU1.Bin065]|nr:MAG: hypothetical protein A4E56_01888 [Pelotomaculum sp. PtaU1.Bin065]